MCLISCIYDLFTQCDLVLFLFFIIIFIFLFIHFHSSFIIVYWYFYFLLNLPPFEFSLYLPIKDMWLSIMCFPTPQWGFWKNYRKILLWNFALLYFHPLIIWHWTLLKYYNIAWLLNEISISLWNCSTDCTWRAHISIKVILWEGLSRQSTKCKVPDAD